MSLIITRENAESLRNLHGIDFMVGFGPGEFSDQVVFWKEKVRYNPDDSDIRKSVSVRWLAVKEKDSVKVIEIQFPTVGQGKKSERFDHFDSWEDALTAMESFDCK